MRSPNTESGGHTISVTIGRFGDTPQTLTVPVDTTVSQALRLAEVEVGDGSLFVNGESANGDNLLDNGDVLTVATNKQGA